MEMPHIPTSREGAPLMRGIVRPPYVSLPAGLENHPANRTII